MTKRRKEHEVLGKYAGTETGITRIKSPGDNNPSRDISKVVDSNAQVNGGASGALKKPPNWNR